MASLTSACSSAPTNPSVADATAPDVDMPDAVPVPVDDPTDAAVDAPTPEAVPVPVVEAQVVEVIGQVQTKGSAAIKKVPKIDGIVLGQLPADYHMADEKKILKALGMGLTVPGVTYHMESEIKSSRGSLK